MISPFAGISPFIAPRQGGGVASSPWITAPQSTSPRNDGPYYLGVQLLVGAADLKVTALGRLFLTGNTQSHDVGLFDSTGNPIVIASVDCSSGVDQQYNWSPAAATLAAATNYYLAVLELGGGDNWLNPGAPTVSGDASIVVSTYRPGTGTSGAFNTGGLGDVYSIPNFQYHL